MFFVSYEMWSILVLLGLIFISVYTNLTGTLMSVVGKFFNYLSTVLENCKNSRQEETLAPSKLEKYSKTMKTWYEECMTDNETDDDIESDPDPDEDDVKKKNLSFVSITKNENILITTITKIQQATTSTQTKDEFIETNRNSHQTSDNWRWQNYAYDPSHPCDLNAIRRIQDEKMSRQVRFLCERDLKAPLVICVEASCTNISGYLLNFRAKICKFYTYGIDHLPWDVVTHAVDLSATEIKMKNLIFALLLWEQEILNIKKFSIYTNCGAVNHRDYEHGKIANDFIEHFTSCANIIRVNSNPQVSRYRDTDVFAHLLQPAGDLVKWNLFRFQKFIKTMYGFTRFEGSHTFLDDYQDSSKDDGYFARSYRYHYFLSKVNKNAEKWAIGCRNCGLRLSKSSKYSVKEQISSDSEDLFNSEIIPYPLADNCW